MSYILDALRRAESERERERGGVPGLNAQPIPVQSADRPFGRRNRPWIWVVAGIGLGLLLPLAWHLLADDDSAASSDAAQRAREPTTGAVAMPSQPPTSAPPIADAPAQAAVTPAAPAQAAVAPAAAAPSVVALPASAAASAAPPARAKAKAPVSAAPGATAARKPPPVPQAAARAQAAAPSAPEVRIPKLAELPDELRRGVPALAFGGAVYSEVPAQRMVILNGQLLREGEALSADLTLETIRAKSAVLRIKGERFELVF